MKQQTAANHRKPHPHVKAYQNQRTSVAEARRQRKPVRSISHGVIRVPMARILWGCSDTHDRRCAPQSWDTWKRVPPAHCRSDWALCRLAVAGYDVWCVWLVRCLAWWCRITVVIAWRCTRTSGTHWVVVTKSPTTVAAAPQSWDTWKRVPSAHCRLGWAWCSLANAGFDVCG